VQNHFSLVIVPVDVVHGPWFDGVYAMNMVRNLLDLIYSAESGRNYDAWNTQTKIRSERPLTELTVAEIMAIQEKNRGNDGGAAGAGQIKKSTMQLLLNNKILSKDDKFTPEVQDRAHLFLLQNRGLNDFLSGQIDLNEYGHRLSKEYASLPSMKGETPDMSYYEGEAKNSARVKPAEINAQLSALLDIDSEANLDLANQGSGITNNVATGVDPQVKAMAAAVMEAREGDNKRSGIGNIMMESSPRPMPMPTPTSALQVSQRPPSAMDRFTGGIASLKDSIGNMFRMGN